MTNFNPIITLLFIIGVLQVCTAKAIAIGEETNVTQLFTADELQRARQVGLTDHNLITGLSRGATAEEMIQVTMLSNLEKQDVFNGTGTALNITNFEKMVKMCEIFVPQYKTTPDAASALEIDLDELLASVNLLPRDIQFHFLRTTICSYLSDPRVYQRDANSFGLKLTAYLKFDFWQLKHQNATGVERVNVAKGMCCIYKGRENVTEFKIQSDAFGLQKMNDFAKHWNEFESKKTAKSFVNNEQSIQVFSGRPRGEIPLRV